MHTKRPCWNDVNDRPSKENAKKEKGVHTKRACLTAVSLKPSEKTQKEKKGVQHDDFQEVNDPISTPAQTHFTAES